MGRSRWTVARATTAMEPSAIRMVIRIAALLRSYSTTSPGDVLFQGDAYCASCHIDRENDVWDGMSVWTQTAHSSEITPTTETDIACTACHAAHGSNNPPLITEQLVPPAAPTTLTVPANDRWLCFGCHPGSLATYPGGLTYQYVVSCSVDSEHAHCGGVGIGRGHAHRGRVSELSPADGCIRWYGRGRTQAPC